MKFYVTVKQSNIHFITNDKWQMTKMTKLCCFSQDNPPFLVYERHAELNANGFIQKTEWPSSSPDLNPLDCHIWGTMLEKYHKLQPKTTDELKVTLQTIWEEMTREHVNKAVAIFYCLRGCGCQWWSLWASAVTLSVCKSASSSHQQQTGSFQRHQQTIHEDNARNAEKWGIVLVEIA